jgi:hypothetical protein
MKPLRHPPFLLYFWARAFRSSAIRSPPWLAGYALTGSAFAPGMVGLVQTALLFSARPPRLKVRRGGFAARRGAVPAAALGGVGTVAVALLWMKRFPTLRDVERLE